MFKKISNSNKFIYFLSAFWAIAVAIPVGYLMGFHQPFKSTASETLLREKIKTQRSVLHLIGAYCPCSVKVVDHLIKRKPLNTIPEKVIIIGENAELVGKLTNAGFQVESMKSEFAYQRYEINVLPQMIIYDFNTIAYSGGYSKLRSPASEENFEDVKIINDFFKGTHADALPIFGCANGKNNQEQLDPLNLKYNNEKDELK